MAAIPYAEYQKLSLWWLFGSDSVNTLDKVLIGGQRSRNDTAERFLHDIHKSLIEMKRILVKKKYCCITIGNPLYRDRLWPLNDLVKKDATNLGFTLLREKIRGKYRTTNGKIKEEYILVFRNE